MAVWISSKLSLGRLALTWALGAWRHVVEPNEINILAFTVLRDLEQINDAHESRLARQCWGDIRKTDRLNRIHFDLTFFHTVSVAHYDVGTHPHSDTAGDFSSTNSIAKSLGKRHEMSVHSAIVGGVGASAISTYRRLRFTLSGVLVREAQRTNGRDRLSEPYRHR